MFDKMLYVYAKHDSMKQFKAFDVNGCFTVERLIYATLLENSQENRMKLQEQESDNSLERYHITYLIILDEPYNEKKCILYCYTYPGCRVDCMWKV